MNFRLTSILLLVTFPLIVQGCYGNLKEFLQKPEKPKIYIEPVQVGIEIDSLSSISSRSVPKEKFKDEISCRSQANARWFYLQLTNAFEKTGYHITSKDGADLIIKTSIVDMSEIRPKMFIEGLSIGLVFGFIAGEVTGEPEVGLAVFLVEVVEEFVILYILKSYFLVTTIETKFITPNGEILKSTEFTAYSNKEYINSLPKQKQSLRESKVHASLDQNAKDIVEFVTKHSEDGHP